MAAAVEARRIGCRLAGSCTVAAPTCLCPPYGCSSRPPSQRERSSSRPPSPREERGEGAHHCCGDDSDQNGDESNRALDAADDGLPSLLATQAILARPVQPLPALCGERSDCAAIRVRGMAHAQPGSRIHRTCTSMRRCADMVTGQLQGSRTSRVAAPCICKAMNFVVQAT